MAGFAGVATTPNIPRHSETSDAWWRCRWRRSNWTLLLSTGMQCHWAWETGCPGEGSAILSLSDECCGQGDCSGYSRMQGLHAA